MTAFMIRPSDEDAIKAALNRARQHPLMLSEVVKNKIAKQDVSIVHLKDRTAEPAKKHIENVMLPFGYRLAISCEEQPAGFCAHLSMSSPRAGRVPRPEAIDMVLQVLGLQDAECHSWLEEFDPGHMAVNVIALLPSAKPRVSTRSQ